MRILVIESSSEGQVEVARRVETLPAAEIESLDISVALAGPQNFSNKLGGIDVVLLGENLAGYAQEICYAVRSAAPKAEIMMFASARDYSSKAFRDAHLARVRKVLPSTATELDLLQELVRIHEEFRADGRTKEGQIIVVMQAKGGVGCTTTAAALAEAAARRGKRVVVLDCDVESRDLSRALKADRAYSDSLATLIEQSRPITKDFLEAELVEVFPGCSLLPLPSRMAPTLELAYQLVGAQLAMRILQLLRMRSDVVIIDAGGRVTPATGAMLSMADKVAVVIDDSLLGMSAVPSMMALIRPLVSNIEHFQFICSGAQLSLEEVRQAIDPEGVFGERAWSVPVVPMDKAGQRWAGTGKTLYSLGRPQTAAVFDAAASALGIQGDSAAGRGGMSTERKFSLHGLAGLARCGLPAFAASK